MSRNSGSEQESNVALVFPHIAKTGGTTMLYHFRKGLGDPAICSYGPHNRAVRFFGGLPQLEEMTGDELSAIKLIQGHGVDEFVVSHLAGREVRLLTILRSPISLIRSRYNHRVNSLAKLGREVPTKEFVDELASNQMCKFFCKAFPGFIDDESASLASRAISVLRKFQYVFVTEKLDEQVAGMMTSLGLPTELERRRVAESYHVLEVSDAVLEEKNQDDLALFEAVNRPAPQDGWHNAIGFDAEGLSRARARLRQPEPDEGRDHSYEALADSLCNKLMAEAALAALSKRPGTVGVRGAERLRVLLEGKWAKAKASLPPRQARISAENLQKWLARNEKG